MHRILLAVTAMSIALSNAAAGTVTARDGWVVIDTRQSFPTLVERLEAAVKAEKIGLVTSASASEGSQGGGNRHSGQSGGRRFPQRFRAAHAERERIRQHRGPDPVLCH